MLLLFSKTPAKGTAAWLGYSGYETRPRTDRDIRRMREELGLIEPVAEVIEAVAQRQAAANVTDEQKRFEELARELELKRLEWDARYLELLNERREYLISREIGIHLQRKLQEEQNSLLMLMVAAS